MLRFLRRLLRRPRLIVAILVLGIVATGIATFVAGPTQLENPTGLLRPNDGRMYVVMAASLLDRGEMYDGHDQPSRHGSPLFPLFLAPFVLLPLPLDFGPRIGSFVSYLLAIAAILYATRDLFGRRAGLLAAAAYASFPITVRVTAGYASDNLIALCFVMTLWSVLRGTRQPRFMLIAGIFAGLLALARANFLPFLLLACAGGAAWRLRHRGLRGIGDPYYIAGAIAFVTMVGGWAARNHYRFGDVRSDIYYYLLFDAFLASPPHLALTALAFQTTLVVAVLVAFAFCFEREIGSAIAVLREALTSRPGADEDRRLFVELTSGLWLATFLSAAFIIVSASIFFNWEALRPGVESNLSPMGTLKIALWNGYWRYYQMVLIPMGWLAFLHAPRWLLGSGRAPAVENGRGASPRTPAASGGLEGGVRGPVA